MYCEFYQLSERPFNVTPDPKFLYLNARYREAIASLNYGITQRKGFITLIGEAGTGKTTLLNKLLEELDPKTRSIFIFNTNVTFEEILEYIFAEFDLPVHNGKKLYMLQRLNAFLLEELRKGGNVALLIDEAQDLEFSVLEDLRLLSNLETAKEKILQIVLSGQPELGQKLSNPILRQLRQRIGINCRLLPLSHDEITEYIQYRLQAGGCPDLKLFSREAEDQIYHFSRGIPRLVNVICDNALVIGYALGKKRIGADVVIEAAADLLSVDPAAEEPVERPSAVVAAPAPLVHNRWTGRLGVLGVVIVAVIAGLLSMGRTMFQRHEETSGLTDSKEKSQQFEVIRPGSQAQGLGVEAPAAESEEHAAVAAAAPDEPAAPGERRLAAGQIGAKSDTAAANPAERQADVATRPAQVQEQRLGAGEEQLPIAAGERQPLPERVEAAPSEPRQTVWTGEPAVPNPAVPAAPAVTAKLEPASPPSNVSLLKAWQQDVEQRQQAAKPHAQEEPRRPSESVRSDIGHSPRLDGMSFGTISVRDGDSMSGIARRKYGQASYTILDLLKLANPDLRDIDVISVGQTIRLPDLGEGFPVLTDGAGHYALLVYSSPHAARASSLQSALRARGFDARVSGGSIGAQKPTFRVVVAGFSDRTEVANVGKQLQKLLREDSRITRLGE
jgi:general secretion pathway protein A